jgi:hypothetical protein
MLLDGVHSNPAPAMTADAGGAQVMRVAAAEIHQFSPFVSRGRRRAQISVEPHVLCFALKRICSAETGPRQLDSETRLHFRPCRHGLINQGLPRSIPNALIPIKTRLQSGFSVSPH